MIVDIDLSCSVDIIDHDNYLSEELLQLITLNMQSTMSTLLSLSLLLPLLMVIHGDNDRHTMMRSVTVDPEVYMNITEIIQHYGYPCENHEVMTEDHYILSMQRIPRGKINNTQPGPRPVVLLQHGLLDSAHTWVMNTPSQSLGFILADLGFDVWLTNSRGTTYSKRHKNISPKSKLFWEFTFDQMAQYDLPAFIKHALKVTQAKKVSYIGHSQGTMMAFAQLSRDNNTAHLVSSFVALGPVTSVIHIARIPRFIIEAVRIFAPILEDISYGEFLPNAEFEKFVANTICTMEILNVLCEDPIFWIAGFDVANLNKSRLPVIIGHTPAGTSVQNLLHFYQLYKSGLFQMYDYGSPEANMYHYGTKTPPRYDVTKLDVPLAMYWGGKDTLADPEDVKILIPLVSKTLKHQKYIDYYMHLDYVWAIDAHKVIYPEIVDFIRSYA